MYRAFATFLEGDKGDRRVIGNNFTNIPNSDQSDDSPNYFEHKDLRIVKRIKNGRRGKSPWISPHAT